MDLYSIGLDGLASRKMCGGNTGDKSDENSESCVMVTGIPGLPGAVELTDSKNPGAGALRFDAAEMREFVLGYAAENDISL
ncbi:MAG: DUF397 domain-containing protein [Umezawaea sp.]